MNKIIISILLSLFTSTTICAEKLNAYFTYCTFNTPNNGPYIETYLSVVGKSAVYVKNENNSYQSKIEVTLIFKQGDKIVKFKKYNLLSPELSDSSSAKVNFLDQQRISLPNGKYEFEISITDLNANNPPFNATQILTINYPVNEITVSDIELIESTKKSTKNSIITKSGYDIVPYTSDFYSENFNKIAFYCEIYNANIALSEGDDYLLSYYIESFDNNKLVGEYKSFAREKAKQVSIILSSFTIEKLPSGNYNLVVEARDKKNELLTRKKIFFQRSNPSASPILMATQFQESFVSKIVKSDLIEYIKSVTPIATNVEVNFAQNQIKGEDEKLMRQFFYNFWVTRNEQEPEKEWNEYLKKVTIVNKLFSTQIKKGYTTDRGNIFLKYGKPDTRSQSLNEPSSYPYEIWHYYHIGNFNNKKFVFYNPFIGMNEYPMLHSTMPGHINNPQWKIRLHKRTNQPTDLDTENNNGHYGGRANDIFNNPR